MSSWQDTAGKKEGVVNTLMQLSCILININVFVGYYKNNALIAFRIPQAGTPSVGKAGS